MSNQKTEVSVPISISEITRKLTDTIPVEINLLEPIETFLQNTISQENNLRSRYEESLIHNLSRYIEDWQLYGEAHEGLGSGSVGEAFAHFVALGILKDFPQIRKIRKSDRKGIDFKNTPKSELDPVSFKVKLFIKDNNFAVLRFNTSQDIISKRLAILRQQVNTPSGNKVKG
jgi:hypothetical protein